MRQDTERIIPLNLRSFELLLFPVLRREAGRSRGPDRVYIGNSRRNDRPPGVMIIVVDEADQARLTDVNLRYVTTVSDNTLQPDEKSLHRLAKV